MALLGTCYQELPLQSYPPRSTAIFLSTGLSPMSLDQHVDSGSQAHALYYD
jgi:hypothetical protein